MPGSADPGEKLADSGKNLAGFGKKLAGFGLETGGRGVQIGLTLARLVHGVRDQSDQVVSVFEEVQMRKKLGAMLCWLALTTLVAANMALAMEFGGGEEEEYWTCGMVAGPPPDYAGQLVCIDFLYSQCSCSWCVFDCIVEPE